MKHMQAKDDKSGEKEIAHDGAKAKSDSKK